MEAARYVELTGIYSDVYKSAHGIRPTFTPSAEEIESELKDLSDYIDMVIVAEKAIEMREREEERNLAASLGVSVQTLRRWQRQAGH